MLPAALTDPATAIAERLKERGETIAIAESASGGLISAALLAMPGASAYYAGGVVIYTLVGASATLSPDDPLPDDTRGASEPFATWLATKAAARLAAHWSVGETGAAGPSGNRYGDPAGHAWVAVKGPDGQVRTRNVLTGLDDRARNMELFAAAGLAGAVVWGLHRDTPEVVEIGLPVFSYGTCPVGPLRTDERGPDALASARFGDHVVQRLGDRQVPIDRVLFVAADRVADVLATAIAIARTERLQAGRIRAGETLREQTAFGDYLERREDPVVAFQALLWGCALVLLVLSCAARSPATAAHQLPPLGWSALVAALGVFALKTCLAAAPFVRQLALARPAKP